MQEPWNWTRTDLDALVGQRESLHLDFKQSALFNGPPERIAENLSAEVSAFANTEGGTLVIGMIERKEGRARIADQLDGGISSASWPPERLEQLVTSNVHPYLPGIRLKYVPLDNASGHFACIIAVPQGTTAYQARDHRYYGRSEYQSLPLLDHDIRLRMFRGRMKTASLRVGTLTSERVSVPFNSISRSGALLSSGVRALFSNISNTDPQRIVKCVLQLAIENSGEININEFKLSWTRTSAILEWNTRNANSFAARDGVPPSFAFNRGTPQSVNIFPHDNHSAINDIFYFTEDEDLDDAQLAYDWTLYLSDTLPISGKLTISKAVVGERV
ncbi:MAG TPA: hypothetical protein DEV93_11310 [Chloroflexi bacterium]|jgi:hypothetical protein|nr:hypothetical protein [Chloroflexota bacterium]